MPNGNSLLAKRARARMAASEPLPSPVRGDDETARGVSDAAPCDALDELATFVADPELAGMFIADAVDHLSTIEASILKLEASPADLKLVNDIFRPFHTVKGNAGVL